MPSSRSLLPDSTFASLARRSLFALALCAVLVVTCYAFVDRPVATFVHAHDLHRFAALRWLTLPPPIIQEWAPVALVALAARRAFGPFTPCERVILAASVCIIVADQFRQSLAYVFGRYWPTTWIHDNPSYIRDGAYGFHLFHGGEAEASFPSGHTTRMAAMTAAVWGTYPGPGRILALASIAVAVGLVGMNYHFVGDVVAGAFLGGIVGAYGTALSAATSR